MPEVTLYHVPPSFYSQIARLALAEKGVKWKSIFIAAGPPTFESYEPWYMRLNPGGTVPTLVHDGHIVPDSVAIARYADANFEGPRLIPTDEPHLAEMERWIEKLAAISVRELSYGNEKLAWIGARINRWRIRSLKRRERKNPDMAQVYREKIRDIEGFAENAVDAAHVEKIRERVIGAFDDMEVRLGNNPWLSGGDYSLADTLWTVALCRFRFLGIEPLIGRPALEEWFSRVKARPSFDIADVWETFRFSKLLPILLLKLGPRLAAMLLVIAGIWVLLWWLL